MLHTIRKLLGEKKKHLVLPIGLMSLDAVGSIVLYIILYLTVTNLLNNTLTTGRIMTFTLV